MARPKLIKSNQERMTRRKEAMEKMYVKLWESGMDRALIMVEIANAFFVNPYTVYGIIKPIKLRKRLKLK